MRPADPDLQALRAFIGPTISPGAAADCNACWDCIEGCKADTIYVMPEGTSRLRVAPGVTAMWGTPEVEERTRVELVQDPCHPCNANPIIAALKGTPMDSGAQRQYHLVYTQALPAGELLCQYSGDIRTGEEDSKYLYENPEESHVRQVTSAYTFDINLPRDWFPKGLVMAADPSRCKGAYASDPRNWPRGPDDPPCKSTPCNCHAYAGRQANAVMQHGLIKRQGLMHPLLWLETSTSVEAGDPVLFDYGENFFTAYLAQVKQYAYIERLRAENRSLSEQVSGASAATGDSAAQGSTARRRRGH
jgi:hypothetical protein